MTTPRFCVSARLMPRERTQLVCDGFLAAMRAHGVPQQVLTDNGKVFTGKYAQPPVDVLFDRLCRENGVDHLLTQPHSPTTTGKIERFHRTLRIEFDTRLRLVLVFDGSRRISSPATASSGWLLPSARHKMRAPSMPATAATAIDLARSGGSLRSPSRAASSATQDRKVPSTIPIRSSSKAPMSIATPATAQPDEPREASTDWRQRSMKQASRSEGVVAEQARRWPSTWSEVQRIASSASCLLPSGKW